MSQICKIENNPFLDENLPGTSPLESEPFMIEGLEFINLVPPRGGTEVDSALRLIKAAQNGNVAPLSLQEGLSLLLDPVKPIFKKAVDAGVITIGSAGLNLFQLIKLGLDVKNSKYFENRAIVTQWGASPARAEVLSDIQQQVARSSLKASVLFIRTIKGATVLISNPITKKLAQATCDASSHAITLYRGTTTNAPELSRNPQIVTWKDTAHKISKNALTTISLIGSIAVIASSFEAIDDDSMAYSVATKGALASTVLNIGYTVLQ